MLRAPGGGVLAVNRPTGATTPMGSSARGPEVDGGWTDVAPAQGQRLAKAATGEGRRWMAAVPWGHRAWRLWRPRLSQ